MKKILFFLLFMFFMYINPLNTQAAAYSNWQSVRSGCEARIVTDAVNYYKNATTIDWYVESRGSSCGTLYYDAVLAQSENYNFKSPNHTGYFSFRSPTKKFRISDTSIGTRSGTYRDILIIVRFTNANAMSVFSHLLTVHR